MTGEDANSATRSLTTGDDRSPAAVLSPGIVLQDRYVIGKQIGRGGGGVVYLAQDRRLVSRPVVVKVLPKALTLDDNTPTHPGRFQKEIEALARIDHPGVVGILDAGLTADGSHFLVMNYVEGCSLRSVITPNGIEFRRLAHMAEQIGEGLSAAHDIGIYHRDLKPENIMLQRTADGAEIVKLIDFGLARIMGSQLTATLQSLELVGTPLYMAPEQFEGKADAASDIFAMGLIAYELATGRRAFKAETVPQLQRLHRTGPPVRPTEIRPELPRVAEAVILRALSYDPRKRHRHARDFGRELAQALTTARTRAGAERAEPKLGRLVFKMCNRRSQEDAFRHFFTTTSEARPGEPHICFIHGEEGECHESLVERLTYWIELVAAEKYGPHTGSIRIKKIPWQYEGALEARMTHLLSWIFEALSVNQPATNVSAGAFSELVSRSLEDFIVLQHDIRTSRWDGIGLQLLDRYIRYWESLHCVGRRPQLVIFLNFIYPVAPRETIYRFWRKPRCLYQCRRKRNIQRELSELARTASSPCLMLSELGPVSRDDVLEWFSLYDIYDSEEIRLQRMGTVFKGASGSGLQKSMAEIELHLRDIHRQFVSEQGYL